MLPVPRLEALSCCCRLHVRCECRCSAHTTLPCFDAPHIMFWCWCLDGGGGLGVRGGSLRVPAIIRLPHPFVLLACLPSNSHLLHVLSAPPLPVFEHRMKHAAWALCAAGAGTAHLFFLCLHGRCAAARRCACCSRLGRRLLHTLGRCLGGGRAQGGLLLGSREAQLDDGHLQSC